MATDAKLVGQPVVTKIAAFPSLGVDLATRAPFFGILLWMRVIFSAALTTAGAGTAVFIVSFSTDNVTFTGVIRVPSAMLVLSTVAQAGEIFIPIVTSLPYRYVRVELESITGTNATVTYQADITEATP